MNKFRILGLILIYCIFCFTTPAFSAQNVKLAALDSGYFQGHAEYTDKKEVEDSQLFTGEVEVLDKKTEIKMTVSQVLSASLSAEGDEFFAEVSSELEGQKGLVLPTGTIAHGTIQNLTDAKHLGRDGYIDMTFDYLVTPDGREIPIEGHMTTKLNPVAGVAKVVAEDLGYNA